MLAECRWVLGWHHRAGTRRRRIDAIATDSLHPSARGGAPGVAPSALFRPSIRISSIGARVYLPTMRKLTPDGCCRYRKFTQIGFTGFPVRVPAASIPMRLCRFAAWSEILAGRAALAVLRCLAMPEAVFHSTPGTPDCPTAVVCRLAWSEPGTGVAVGLRPGRCGIKPFTYQVDDGVPAGYMASISRNVSPWDGYVFPLLRGIAGYFPTPRM